MAPVTLQTIADRVGVSRTTVSNAWSKPDQLSEQLRQRVLAVAAELGYAGPDPVARSLRSGQVGAIGVLLTESLAYVFADPYSVPLLQGIGAALEDAGASMLLIPLPPGTGVGRALPNAAVDGIVALSLPSDHPGLEYVRRRGLPLVTIDSPRLEGIPFVGIDDRRAMRELAESVLADGHRQVLVLTFRVQAEDAGGPVDRRRLTEATYRQSAERIAGVLEAVAARGLPDDAVAIREVQLNHREHAARQVTEALQGSSPPTLVLATSDELAIGAVQAARAAGLEIGRDLAVTGFDDVPEAADYGLTTVRQPAADKGAQAATLLLAPGPSDEVLFSHELVHRRSHAEPA